MTAERSLLLKYALSVLLSAVSLGLGWVLRDLWPDSGFVSGLILMGTGPMFAIRFAQLRAGVAPAQAKGRALAYLPWVTTVAGIAVLAITFSTAAGLAP